MENPPHTEGPQTSPDQTHLQQLISCHLQSEDIEETEKQKDKTQLV